MNKLLTIKNRDKIIGREFQTPSNKEDVWIIDSVIEEHDAYGFVCIGPDTTVCVELSRIGEPVSDGSMILFQFRGGGSHSLTADWFADMDNAVSAIADRVDYLWFI